MKQIIYDHHLQVSSYGTRTGNTPMSLVNRMCACTGQSNTVHIIGNILLWVQPLIHRSVALLLLQTCLLSSLLGRFAGNIWITVTPNDSCIIEVAAQNGLSFLLYWRLFNFVTSHTSRLTCIQGVREYQQYFSINILYIVFPDVV